MNKTYDIKILANKFNLREIFIPKKLTKEEEFYTNAEVKNMYFASIERLQRLNYNLESKKNIIIWLKDENDKDYWEYKYPEEIKLIEAEILKENIKLNRLIDKYKIPNYAYGQGR